MTVPLSPFLSDWSGESLNKLRLDTNNFYFQKLMEMTDALIKAGKDKFISEPEGIRAGLKRLGEGEEPPASSGGFVS